VSETAFDDYLAQWRGGNPQRTIAWLFLRPDERTCFGAIAALEQEWLKVLREAREPQVAGARLGWWREEMQRAPQAQARHPLTQGLFAASRASAVPARCWVVPVEAAMALLAAPSPADFAAQRMAVAPLADALAELETRAWFGNAVASPRAAKVTLLAHLTADLRGLESAAGRGRTPLPMNLLARHGLTLDALGGDSPARRAAVRDYAAELQREMADAARMPGPLTVFRAVGLQHDLDALGLAIRSDEPLAALRSSAFGLRGLLKTWRAARTWRSMAPIESNP
jgi:phytoene synthase